MFCEGCQHKNLVYVFLDEDNTERIIYCRYCMSIKYQSKRKTKYKRILLKSERTLKNKKFILDKACPNFVQNLILENVMPSGD